MGEGRKMPLFQPAGPVFDLGRGQETGRPQEGGRSVQRWCGSKKDGKSNKRRDHEATTDDIAARKAGKKNRNSGRQDSRCWNKSGTQN